MSLDRPALVSQCASEGRCVNGPYYPADAGDAADDVGQPPPDLGPADEPAGPKQDLGPDMGPDAGADAADASPENKDVTGDQPNPSDLAADPGPEVGADTIAPGDAGSDLGREVGKDGPSDQGGGATDVGNDDVSKDDVAKDDVSKDDVAKDDVSKDDVVKDDVVKDDVVKDDVTKDDVAGPEVSPDGRNTDVSNTACPAVNPVSGGTIAFGTTNAVCFVTCDDMQYGWGCSSFDETNRTVKINGTTVKCGGTLPAKVSPGNYYYFEIGAGGHTWDLIHWSGTLNATCPTPAGGFVP